jgi:prealbumin domain-containing protein
MKRRTIAAAALVALGAAGASSSPAGAATIRDIATNATDPFNLADTEPSIAVNPVNPNDIVVVTFSESWMPGVPAPVWRSANGGVTWVKSFILPQPAAGTVPGDQKVDFDAAGNLFVAELAKGLAVPRCFVFRQTGGPGALLTPGAVYCDDQPHLALERTAARCLGRLYSPFLDTQPSNSLSMVSNSTSSGVTMNDVAVGENSKFENRTTRIATAPNGDAYVIFKLRQGAVSVSLPGSTTKDFENAQFMVRRSVDCGVTWQPPVAVHGTGAVQTLFTVSFGDASKGKVGRARSSDAWIAVDPTSGDVYAAYVRRDASGFAQIYVSRSTNQGANWTTRRVTDGANHSAFPEIAVTANGTLGVLYVDFVNSGPTTIFRHRFARSFDRGVSWTRQTLQSMDPGPLLNAATEFLWGDYEGLTAQGNTFFGVFTGQSIGRTTLQLDPIFFTETAVVPVLTVRKVLTPDDDPGRFKLLVDGTVQVSSAGNGSSTGAMVVSAGTHTISELAVPGTNLTKYTRTIGGDCAADGKVTVAAGQSKVCTITNVHNFTPEELCVRDCREEQKSCVDEADEPGNPTIAQCLQLFNRCRDDCTNPPPPPQPPRLTVRKVLSPAGDPGRFNLRIDGTVRASGVGNGGSTGALEVTAGTHTVSETAAPGTNLADYTRTIGGDCAASGTVTVAAGQSRTCTITNVRRRDPACVAECDQERVDCMAGVGEPGNPTAAQCGQNHTTCVANCPP